MMALTIVVLLVLLPVLAIVALGILVVVVGRRLPLEHVVRLSRRLAASPTDVWSLIVSPEQFPDWRRDVASVVIRDATGDRLSWWELQRRGDSVPYEIIEADPPVRLVTRITESTLPYGGSWTFEITEQGDGVNVTITERGQVRSPLFRFLSRYIFGQETTIKRYLDDLERAIAGNPHQSKEG